MNAYFGISLVLTLLPFIHCSAEAEEEPPYPFTECDHIFDGSSKARGHFSLPMLPKRTPNGVNGRLVPYRNAVSGASEEELSVLPHNIQCIYTFIGQQDQRVKLEFLEFQLSGTGDNCDLEYIDIYSELKTAGEELLSAPLGGRYCGTVAPHVRISLHNIIVIVFHSRVGKRRTETFKLNGRYNFIPNCAFIFFLQPHFCLARFSPGTPLAGVSCGFLIEPNKKRRGTILSPTYPGTYPSNFHCAYLLRGKIGERIRIFHRDFDIYFGGEHCPYDSVTIYDGETNRDPIIRKVCGLQQRLEMFSYGNTLYIEFNTTDPVKSDPRGFVIEYEFSDRFVDVHRLTSRQKGVSHLRGSECDVRVQSNRETIHYIQSPNYPDMYPDNTTCTYILDGLQGDQNLEKVLLTFEEFAVLSDPNSPKATTTVSRGGSAAEYEGEECGAFVGIATTGNSIRAVLANNEESLYNAMLCERIPKGSPKLGPYISVGPRMIVLFGSVETPMEDGNPPYGFRAKVEFKTDFGIPGEAVGDSNKCMFRFKDRVGGSFNSPRYPANVKRTA
jgi:hypothetical protein